MNPKNIFLIDGLGALTTKKRQLFFKGILIANLILVFLEIKVASEVVN